MIIAKGVRRNQSKTGLFRCLEKIEARTKKMPATTVPRPINLTPFLMFIRPKLPI
jgi:hypothetical protein